MKLRSTFVLLMILGITGLAAIPVSGAPVPAKILKVDAQAPKVLETLHDLSLRLYGQTDRFYLVEDSPGTQASLSSHGLSSEPMILSSALPLYLIYLSREDILDRIRPLASVLLVDDRMALVQMDEATALHIPRLGGKLVRLPDTPYVVNLPPVRSFSLSATADTFVQRLVNKVNQDSLQEKIRRLQDFRTRYLTTDSCRAAEQYIYNYFTALGLDSVSFDSLQFQGHSCRNVVGTRLGRSGPQTVAIVCGHLDAISETDTLNAPGADDNASGAAGVMEAARVLTKERLEGSVKFLAFTGEEWGVGSPHWVDSVAIPGNLRISGAYNLDMIGYTASDTNLLCVIPNTPSRSLAVLAESANAQYGIGLRVLNYLDEDDVGSDHWYFWRRGFRAVHVSEDSLWGILRGSNPYFHTSYDTLGNLRMSLVRRGTQLAMACLATLTFTPLSPDDFVLRDVGIGGSLEASWLPNPELDLMGYKLLWGAASRTYTDSVVLGLVTSCRISGLQNGTRYYATIVAFDSTGHISGTAPEQSAVPGIIPAIPSGLATQPFYFGMRLTWKRNTERDLAGYNLYRSTTPGGNYQRLNAFPLPDTVYRDSSLLSDTMYYYVVTAVDTSRNESPYSLEVRGKPITLDKGILLVDETRDGTGARGNPNDAQQDAYYHYLLQGSRFRDWDVSQQGVPLLENLAPYSTIVWHADDFSDQRVYSTLPGLIHYLSYGGRLWMVGWKPIYGLMNRLGNYPYTFISGQFPYDYLHLSRSTESPIQDFIGATGLAGYPSVSVDSLKVFAVWQGRLPNIDAVFPRDADTIFTFNSASGDTFQGKPVGVRWLNGPYRIVFFGVPFYFMKDQEARQVAIKVLQDLGEPVGVEAGTPSVPFTTTLLPVHPNPFRGSVRVEYSLAEKVRVRLSVYNVAGQMVRELVNESRSPGRYYVSWDGRDQKSHPLPSGVYLYRLEVSGKSWVRKAVLLR